MATTASEGDEGAGARAAGAAPRMNTPLALHPVTGAIGAEIVGFDVAGLLRSGALADYAAALKAAKEAEQKELEDAEREQQAQMEDMVAVEAEGADSVGIFHVHAPKASERAEEEPVWDLSGGDPSLLVDPLVADPALDSLVRVRV